MQPMQQMAVSTAASFQLWLHIQCVPGTSTLKTKVQMRDRLLYCIYTIYMSYFLQGETLAVLFLALPCLYGTQPAELPQELSWQSITPRMCEVWLRSLLFGKKLSQGLCIGVPFFPSIHVENTNGTEIWNELTSENCPCL